MVSEYAEEARCHVPGLMRDDHPLGCGDMKPSVGRMVHYVSYGTPGGEYKSQCRAAVITAVYEDPNPADPSTIQPGETRRMGEVDLCVLNPEGMFFNRVVPQNEPLKPGGTWHWPERVPE